MDQENPSAGEPRLELGAWIGRGQAFALVANRCSAAQAECLKKIHEEGSYKSLELTWEEFCRQYAGISRSYADKLILRLEEFGAAYFDLSRIMRISAESYRLIAGAVTGGVIDIGGVRVPLIPENAPRIQEAINSLRADLKKARAAGTLQLHPGITAIQTRLDACFEEIARMAQRPIDPGELAALQGLLQYARDRLQNLSRSISKEPKASNQNRTATCPNGTPPD